MSLPSMHPPATPDHRDARAFIRALRLSTTPAHLTPARPSTSLYHASASPYYRTPPSHSHTPSHVSSTTSPPDQPMTEDEERAMEAELEHELTALILQEEEEAEEEEEEEDGRNALKQHESVHEHKDNQHDTSFSSNDMLFPVLLSAPSPSTPTRHFHRTSAASFLSPPVRQLPSPTQLHSLLLMTEGRLREREQQVQMAAEVGEALLRQQEEREEEVRQWRQRAEDAEDEVERVRSDMERQQERSITLLTQLREAEAATVEQQRKAAEADEQLALLSTQLTREREKRRGEERQQLSTSTSLVTDNAKLTTTLATLTTQLHSYQQRITLLTQQYDSERTTTAHYRTEAEAWERLVDERERKAKEREDELSEEIDSLSYRCRQLQEAVPMCGPAVDGRSGGVWEAGLVVESSEVKEVREVGRNQRLSMMPYESLLAELEGELQAEIAARQTRATVDDTDKENVNSEANAVKEEETERGSANVTVAKVKAANETSQATVASAAATHTPAVDSCSVEQSNSTSRAATISANAVTPPVASCPTCLSNKLNPATAASTSSSVDVLKEYFHLATLSVKLSSVETNVSACNINVNELYSRVIRDDVAFHRWHVWIQERMREVKPASSPSVSVSGGRAAVRGVVGGKSSPGRAAERERGQVSEKVLYAHGSSVSVSMKQRPPPSAAAAKKAASTGGGLLQSMRRGWGRG